MKPSSTLLSGASWFLLSAALSAQVNPWDPPPTIFAGMGFHKPLPPEMAGKVTTRTVSGNLMDNHQTDVCMLASGELFIARAPDGYNAYVSIPASVAGPNVFDVDVLPRASGPDALAVVSYATGLRIIRYDRAAGTFRVDASVASGGWNRAQSVRAANLDNVTGVDLIGIDNNHTKVLRLVQADSASRASLSSVDVAQTILQALPIQWFGSSVHEIAVTTLNSVKIYDGTALFDSRPLDGDTMVHAVAFQNDGEALQRIAYVGQGPSYQYLHVAGYNVADGGLGLGTLDGVVCTAGDVENVVGQEGGEELVISNQYSFVLPVLFNQSEQTPGATYDIDHVGFYNGGQGSAAANQAEAQLQDLDGDGDLDLVMVKDSEGILVVQRNNLSREFDHAVHIDPGAGTTLSLIPAPGNHPQIEIPFQRPVAPVLHPFDHLQVRVWRQETLNDPAVFIEEQFLPVGSQFQSVLFATEFELETTAIFSSVYTLTARLVQGDESGITEAGNTGYFFYVTDPSVFNSAIAGAAWPPTVNLDDYQGPSDVYYVDGREIVADGAGPSPGAPPGADPTNTD